jgi:two-component system CheB/CheR fusion protein
MSEALDMLPGRKADDSSKAQAAFGLNDEFLAVVSHELKNALNPIHLNAELLMRLPESKAIPAVERAATIIRRAVATQARINDDLLDLSRVSTGKPTLQMTAVDRGPIVGNVTRAMGEDAKKKQVKFDVGLPEQPLVVDADPVRVEQIVLNLLSNALKFTPAGGTVPVLLKREDGFAVLEVRDTGSGIAPEFLPSVIGLFQQSDRSRQQGGLGIGLALVQHLVQRHAGRVTAESEGEDKGAIFTVWLPQHHGLAAVETLAPTADHRRLWT